jgi:hypothetical protein
MIVETIIPTGNVMVVLLVEKVELIRVRKNT